MGRGRRCCAILLCVSVVLFLAFSATVAPVRVGLLDLLHLTSLERDLDYSCHAMPTYCGPPKANVLADGSRGEWICREYANTTVVSMLVDIGRGAWSSYTRPFEFYLKRFAALLQELSRSPAVPMIVLIESDYASWVWRFRSLEHTVVVPVTLKQLKRSHRKLYRLVAETMNSDEYEPNDAQEPEGWSADYNFLMHMKIALLEEYAKLNPFQTSRFYWIDAGYHRDYISERSIFEGVPDTSKLHVQMVMPVVAADASLPFHYRRRDNLHMKVCGSMLGGTQAAISRVAALYRLLLLDGAHGSIMDDDQTYFATLLARHHCSLFFVTVGDNPLHLLQNTRSGLALSLLKLACYCSQLDAAIAPEDLLANSES